MNINDYIIPCDRVLPFESIYADKAMAKKIFNGLSCPCDYIDGTYKLYNERNEFYGLAAVNGGQLKVRTKLC